MPGPSFLELLAVLALALLLATVAVPRVARRVDAAREQALRDALVTLRSAIDRFHADHRRCPDDLTELVERGYLPALPVDPMTARRDTWETLPPPAPRSGHVGDVRSGARGRADDGSDFGAW